MKYNVFEPNDELPFVAKFRNRLLKYSIFDIVFAKPKENTKPTKDRHGYPLDKDHICFPTGHAMSVLFEWDNGSSKTVQRRCTRCGHEELDQYDYN